MQCMSWFLCLEGVFQVVISVILLSLVIEFFEREQGAWFHIVPGLNSLNKQ